MLLRNKKNYSISLIDRTTGIRIPNLLSGQEIELPESFLSKYPDTFEKVADYKTEPPKLRHKVDKTCSWDTVLNDITTIVKKDKSDKKPKIYGLKNKKKIDFLYIFQYKNEHIDLAIKRLICSINSIKNQNVNIIVMNGSKTCIYDCIFDLTPNIFYIHRYCNIPSYKTMLINYAVKNYVEGEYFFLSDIDLVYKKNHIDSMLKLLEEKKKLTKFPIRIVPWNYNIYQECYSSDYNELIKLKHHTDGGYAHGNGLIHLESFKKVRGYNEEMIGYGPEDDLFNIRLKRFNACIYTEDISTVHLWHARFNVYQEEKNMKFFIEERHRMDSKMNLTIEDLIANKNKKDWGVY